MKTDSVDTTPTHIVTTKFEAHTLEYNASYPEITINATYMIPQLAQGISQIDMDALKSRIMNAVYLSI